MYYEGSYFSTLLLGWKKIYNIAQVDYKFVWINKKSGPSNENSLRFYENKLFNTVFLYHKSWRYIIEHFYNFQLLIYVSRLDYNV